MSKQLSTLSKGRNFNAKVVRHCCRFWQQSRTLLRHCCHKRQQCRSNIWHCSIRQCCFDIVAGVDRALDRKLLWWHVFLWLTIFNHDEHKSYCPAFIGPKFFESSVSSRCWPDVVILERQTNILVLCYKIIFDIVHLNKCDFLIYLLPLPGTINSK